LKCFFRGRNPNWLRLESTDACREDLSAISSCETFAGALFCQIRDAEVS
jgi:hypothetical protein